MRRRFACALLLLVGGALGIVAAGQGLVAPTAAAWTDRAVVSAKATAGTWSTVPTGNTCVAYGRDGGVLTGCTVSRVVYEGWGSPGNQTRNYYISFSSPTGARTVSFDVDLTTATGTGGVWSWQNAGVMRGAQFAPRDGWTCAELPRVRGTGGDWLTSTVYFQVSERRSNASTMCP